LLSVCIVVLLFAVCLASLGCVVAQGGQTQNITLYGSATQGWGLTQQSMSIPGPQITFTQGVPVSLTLISVDGNVHDFYVDYNGNGAIDSGEPRSPTFTSTVTYQFTPDRTGQFTYYCSFHAATMRGNTQIVIPELTVTVLVVLMVALTMVAVVYVRKKKTQS
jgi:hypothetical protein